MKLLDEPERKEHRDIHGRIEMEDSYTNRDKVHNEKCKYKEISDKALTCWEDELLSNAFRNSSSALARSRCSRSVRIVDRQRTARETDLRKKRRTEDKES
tara:strand:- start:506 stop:805 length:300 start_codon:yes stop_codon:yes gene_type:complete